MVTVLSDINGQGKTATKNISPKYLKEYWGTNWLPYLVSVGEDVPSPAGLAMPGWVGTGGGVFLPLLRRERKEGMEERHVMGFDRAEIRCKLSK